MKCDNRMNVSKSRIGISLDTIVLKEIDNERGLVPRSRYIQKILIGRRRMGFDVG